MFINILCIFFSEAFSTSYQILGKIMLKLGMKVTRHAGLLKNGTNILVGWTVPKNKSV